LLKKIDIFGRPITQI